MVIAFGMKVLHNLPLIHPQMAASYYARAHRQEQFGVQRCAQGCCNKRTGGAGVEPPTLWSVNNLLYPLDAIEATFKSK